MKPKQQKAFDALLAACKRCIPEWEMDPDEHGGHVACEISVDDVRALVVAVKLAESL